jgi:hypothetical protein
MGCDREGTPQDRRRDRRLSPPGKVRLRITNDAPALEGRIVDVSAGGVRLSCLGRAALRPGQVVEVEIRIGQPMDTVPPPVHLSGRGFVTRLSRATDGGREAAVCFQSPLAIRDAWKVE